MLVSLAVENFLCFAARARLDLGAPPPVSLVVGENASGKSSLRKALSLVRNLVLGGNRPGQPLPMTPNRFLPPGPTRIELSVLHDGARYTYGFAATPQLVEEEWLSCNERTIFLRKHRDKSAPVVVELGDFEPQEKKRLDLVAYGTRPDQLFLNEGLRRGVTNFAPLGIFLRDRLQLILPEAQIVGLAARAAREPGFAAFLHDFLRETLPGIATVDVTRETIEADTFENEEEQRQLLAALTAFPDAFAETPDGELIAVQDRAVKNVYDIFRVKLAVTLNDGQNRSATLSPSELSDGTQRLLHLAPLFYPPPQDKNAPVFFLDDLGRALDPRLLPKLLTRFLKANESHGAQLVASAYDTALVDAGLLKKEQVFVLENRAGGAAIRGL